MKENSMNTKAIRNGLTDEVLKSLYESGITSDEIASRYGMTGAGILYRLKKLGIKRLSSHERNKNRMIEKSGKDIFSLSKDEFYSLLKEKGEREIAKEYGCSRQVMKSLRDKFGIDAIGKTERIHLKLSEWFTDEQEQVLYGSILGDGNIHLGHKMREGDVARYKESHCLKQKNYLEWKRQILGDYITECGVQKDNGKLWKDGRRIYGVCMKSHFHRNFRKVYDWFYDENGKKHLPDNFEEKITPLALAVWYMDDGTIHDGLPSIASCFEKKDIEKICEVLMTEFDIPSYATKKEGDSVAIIHFNKDCFFEIVGDYIIESMAYKVTLPERFSIKCIGKPHLKEYYDYLHIRIKDENIDDLVDYCHVIGFPYPNTSKFDRGDIVKRIKNTMPMINNGVISSGAGCGNDFLISCFENYFLGHSNGSWSAKWNFDSNLIAVLRRIQKSGEYLTDSSLRNELLDMAGIYGFRPVVAKQLYDKYCPENAIVLDPCGGWGGRMLGAYCSDKVKRYDCVDACSETVYGLKHLKMLMDRTVEGKEVNVQYGAYEDSDFENGMYDVVFTSPPYFIKEFYSNDEFQSETRYGRDYGKWLKGFLKPFIEKSVSYLKDGGYFIVNIDNIRIAKKEYCVANDFVEMVRANTSLEHAETLWMTHNNRYRNEISGEPIFVFRKK